MYVLLIIKIQLIRKKDHAPVCAFSFINFWNINIYKNGVMVFRSEKQQAGIKCDLFHLRPYALSGCSYITSSANESSG